MSHASARDCGEDHWPGRESCWEDRHWGRERSQTGLLPPHPSAMTRRQGCENTALAAKITEAKSDVCTQGLRWEVRRRKASLPSPAASPGPPRTVGGDGIGGHGHFPLYSSITAHLPPLCPHPTNPFCTPTLLPPSQQHRSTGAVPHLSWQCKAPCGDTSARLLADKPQQVSCPRSVSGMW